MSNWPPPPNEKPEEISRKNVATLLKTSNLNWKPTKHPPQTIKTMKCLMENKSKLEMLELDAQKLCSTHPKLERKPKVSTNWYSNPFKNVTWISEKISMLTSLCPEVLPCTKILKLDYKKKSKPWLQIPWKSRLLPLLKENTLSGLEEVSFHLWVPSNRCGSLKTNSLKVEQVLSTENASECKIKNFNHIYI